MIVIRAFLSDLWERLVGIILVVGILIYVAIVVLTVSLCRMAYLSQREEG